MLEEFITSLRLFLFIFATLIVIANIFSAAKVIITEQGKILSSRSSLVILGVSIAYIITTLIRGF